MLYRSGTALERTHTSHPLDDFTPIVQEAHREYKVIMILCVCVYIIRKQSC